MSIRIKIKHVNIWWSYAECYGVSIIYLGMWTFALYVRANIAGTTTPSTT